MSHGRVASRGNRLAVTPRLSHSRTNPIAQSPGPHPYGRTNEIERKCEADVRNVGSSFSLYAACPEQTSSKQRSAIGEVGKTVGQFRDDVYARSAALADIKAAEESQRLRRDVLPRFAAVLRKQPAK